VEKNSGDAIENAINIQIKNTQRTKLFPEALKFYFGHNFNLL